tara:strand:+ start:1031 stop:1327 length:297 start_codon:yes stop_codon:yes gene_type:complete
LIPHRRNLIKSSIIKGGRLSATLFYREDDMKDNLYYKAALTHFEAKATEARAVLDTYFNNSVGIGEHSNLLDEIVTWTKCLAEAEEAIDTLNKLNTER